jgi:ATP-dependent 26S proteasome regulatory subunit
MWVGETPKNVVATFRAAVEQNALLFFDEADAIATRRSSGAVMRYDREANLTINVLLRELEAFNGIVIFATNLAANFDPAFERRIRTHVLFEMPGVQERERIWQLQIHPEKTPLAADVDFRALAERYAVSGGDIKNAVIKAAAAAAAEPGPDHGKRIHQRHFEAATEEVMAAKAIMQQSLFAPDGVVLPELANVIPQAERRRRAAVLGALALSGTALLAALTALAIALLR